MLFVGFESESSMCDHHQSCAQTTLLVEYSEGGAPEEILSNKLIEYDIMQD